MKKTKLFAFLGAAVLTAGIALSVGLTPSKSTLEANAGASDVWSICGSMNGWTPSNTTYDMTRKDNDASGNYVWEIQMTLSASDEFKIVKNHKWGGDIGWDNYSTDNGKGDYLKNSGGNFGVKVAGDYIITFTDKSVTISSHNPWAGDVKIEPYSATKHVITYHAETPETEEFSDGAVWNSKFIEKEGYRLEGWYTDVELTTKFEKGSKISSDLDLYPNYIAASDFSIYVMDSSKVLGGSINAYMWRDLLDGGNGGDWPGTAATTSTVAGVVKVDIDASKSYDSIIFNGGNNKPQTINLTLATESTLYVLGAKDTEGKYAASTVTVSVAGLSEYIMAEDTEGQCVAKYPIANTVYLLLSAEEQETFTTDAAHADAKTRYEAWALSLGQTPYVAMSSTKGLLTKMTSENNLMVVILVITASVIACAVAFKLVKKSRKEN